MCWPLRRLGFLRTFSRCEAGQATVETALLVPVLLAVILLLVEPGIILYDRIVMRDAAAQGCRVLMTMSGGDDGTAEAFIRRRLGSIPQQNAFHVHEGNDCSWQIVCSGGAESAEVTVRISTEIEPLPLIGFGAALLGAVNERGHVVIEVETSLPVQDAWVASSGAGSSPAGWIGAWVDA